MLLTLQPLPELIKNIDERLERGLATQERIANDVRDELRAEVRIRDEKLAEQIAEINALKSRVSALEAERAAKQKIIDALDKKDAKKPPWTAIAALIVSTFLALGTYIKDLIN